MELARPLPYGRILYITSAATVLVLVDSQDGVRHPDKGTDKTILLISRHYWRPDRRSDGQELYRCRHIPAYRSSDSLELELDLAAAGLLVVLQSNEFY